ncbi:putative N-acetyltransferase YhbS [Aliiruegeria haliotis]|uniref:Putative N-acetyltransferase YhbS n=1 Tax=Aliiruegeria haliotis TaxID=1280846 RepID=A0A2T0RV45_9RHOB|nr:N-acetyltransferase [Aliiruegeria haliotis]PRY25065.1 putative N-acetyltransferase YhbS [Aliiruegeria haliotis]
MELTQELDEDWWEVEALFDLCFAPGREALSSYRLRDGVDPVAELCRVAREDGILSGAIRAWPVRISGHSAALIGPVAVHPTHQGEGLGGAMIRDVVARGAEIGWHRMLLVGDAPYYGRFGFSRLDDVIMPPPTNPERVLGFGDWTGVRGNVVRAAAAGAPPAHQAGGNPVS